MGNDVPRPRDGNAPASGERFAAHLSRWGASSQPEINGVESTGRVPQQLAPVVKDRLASKGRLGRDGR